VRSYSISAPDGHGLRISVASDRRAGALLHAVTVGSSIEVSAPEGGFGFDPGGTEPVALISAGSGVSPSGMPAGPGRSSSSAAAALGPRRSLAGRALFAAEAERALAQMPKAVWHVRYTCADAATAGNADGRLTL
jgi:hypothetical protein